jgi:hypothetical protein
VGFNGCWLAVEDCRVADLMSKLGLLQANDAQVIEHPFDARGVNAAAMLDSGWALVIMGNHEDRLGLNPVLQAVSKGTRAISAAISEYTMLSDVRSFEDGVCVWSVTHDVSDDVNHLAIWGNAPHKEAEAYRLEAIANRKSDSEVDFMFDVPLQIACDLTSFKHDQAMPPHSALFEVEIDHRSTTSLLAPVKKLTAESQPGKPWWKFW